MRRTITLALAGVGLAGGLLGVACPGVAGSPEPLESLGLVRFDSGIRAPGFTLPDLAGHAVRVSGQGGPATLLVFWATW